MRLLGNLILLLLVLRILILLNVRLDALVQRELAVGLRNRLIQRRVVLSRRRIVNELRLVDRIRSAALRNLNRLRGLSRRRLSDRLEAAVVALELFELSVEVDGATSGAARECDTLLGLGDVVRRGGERRLRCHIRDGLRSVGRGWRLGLLEGQCIVVNSIEWFWCNVYGRCWCWLGVADCWWCLCGLNYLNAWTRRRLNEGGSRRRFRDLSVLNGAVVFLLAGQRLVVVAVLEDGGGCARGRHGGRRSRSLYDWTFRVVLRNVLVRVLDRLVALFLLLAVGVVGVAWVSTHVSEFTLVT